MSTTTNFKRIALVAVAALGLGVLSSVPANAAVSGVTISVTNGATPLRGTSTTTVNSDTGTATGATITITALQSQATDSMTVKFFNKNTLSSTSGMRVYLNLADTTTVNTAVSNAGTAISGTATKMSASSDSSLATVTKFGIYSTDTGLHGGTRTTGNVGATFALFIDTNSVVASAGTYTYTVVVSSYAGSSTAVETSADVSIVVSAPTSASTTPSAVYTTFYASTSDNPTEEAELLPGSATASTTALAYFQIDNRNASNVTGAKDTITATVSGPGLLYNETQAAYGKSLAYFQTGTSTWTIVPDGNAGVATVTFKTSITGLTWTRTVNFYAAKSTSITASNFHPVLKVGANTGAVAVSAKDSLGNAWTGTAYIYASSAADALIAGSVDPVQCAAYNSTTGILCPVTAVALGTAKLKVIDAATVSAASATSNEITVTVKAITASGVKIAFDKATYAPGEKALLTVTPVDAAGGKLPTVTITNLLDTGGITTNLSLGSGSDTITGVTMTTSASLKQWNTFIFSKL